MITNERLNQILAALCYDSMHDYEEVFDSIKNGEIGDMAKELITRRNASEAEKSIGVWNPSTNEIAVSHSSGIKLVDVAHWHCHCTMEVIVREMSGHPLVLAREGS